jgi:hypothetical protein
MSVTVASVRSKTLANRYGIFETNAHDFCGINDAGLHQIDIVSHYGVESITALSRSHTLYDDAGVYG